METKKQLSVANISDQVMNRINVLTEGGQLVLPQNYSAENALKSAWLTLQETTDRSGKQALQVCTKESIANSLFDMVLQGLSVAKKQGYFIVYGNKLLFQRSYFGSVALAKRAGGIVGEPHANVVYEGDDFVYDIDPKTGQARIVRHAQKLENIDDTKIKGAYCIVQKADGTSDLTIMTMEQIRKAWNQGATKGQSPAHKNFPAEMCKKSVIGRACKMIINSCDDAWLYDGKADEDTDMPMQARNEQVNAEVETISDADFAEVVEPVKAEKAPIPATKQEEKNPTAPVDTAPTEELPFGDGDEEPNY
jgi:recombination protein RecT